MTATRVLVTGGGGFVAAHLCACLNAHFKHVELTGTDIVEPVNTPFNRFYLANVWDSGAIEDVVASVVPDYVIHLAGVFGSEDVQKLYRVNVLSMPSLLEAVRKYSPRAIVIGTGSAAEYGQTSNDQLPVNEQTTCRPITSYGLSKLLATEIAMYYYKIYSVCVMIARPFQLIGKGMSSQLAPGAFASQLKQSVVRETEVLRVGNLQSSRDFLDVRDFTEAILALCHSPAPGHIFNICSGKAVKIIDLLKLMINVSNSKVRIEIDSALLRGQSDVSIIFGDYRKIQNYCGWHPKLSLRQSIEAMFEEDLSNTIE